MTRFLILFLIVTMFLLSKASAQMPVALSWKLEGNLPSEDNRRPGLGVAGPVTGYSNSVLIIAGGANFPDSLPWKGGKKKYYDKVYVFKKDAKQLKTISTSFQLPFTIAYSANCSTEKGIIYAGGENEAGISSKVFLLNWNESNAQLLISNLPDLPEALTNASSDCIGDIIYVAGGETAQGVSKKLYSLDLNSIDKGWKILTDLPVPVSHTVLLAVSRIGKNFLYLAGGRSKQANGISDLYNHLLIYDVANNSWYKGKPIPYAISAGTGAAFTGKGIFVFGGDKGEVFHKVEMLNAALQKTMSEEEKKNSIEEKNNLLTKHPGFSKEILFYDFSIDEWRRIGSIPFKTPVTTTAIKVKEYVFIPSGEIRAGVRTPAILSVKLSPKRK
jgi:N-acetylneuraminate epimerase